jgi:hypothetical protein
MLDTMLAERSIPRTVVSLEGITPRAETRQARSRESKPKPAKASPTLLPARGHPFTDDAGAP